MVSYSVTEKAYSLRDANGEFLPGVKADINAGPAQPANIMAITAAMLYERYLAGAYPIALVSMDNCNKNGERLRSAVLEIALEWARRGFCDDGFTQWLGDESRVSFPWSMIDKITPWPSDAIAKRLAAAGISDMAPVRTAKGSMVAPFVNTEPAQYLVVEDNFPGGRPPLEKAGVIFTDRITVNRAEAMKVGACLNPLHTALAVFGFLLGYKTIAEEMGDAALLALVRRIAYDEGLPAVSDPGVINPKAFLDEAVNERLPNPMLPDAPARIATDTSQKIPIRFGGTLHYYIENAGKCSMPEQPVAAPSDLIGIPLTFAGWLRYLTAVDDTLATYAPSPDPMLGVLCGRLSQVKIRPEAAGSHRERKEIEKILSPILSDASLFGADLYDAGLAEKVVNMFIEMIAGEGAVRRTLVKYLL
jgi:fructuronate reductase